LFQNLFKQSEFAELMDGFNKSSSEHILHKNYQENVNF